MVRSFFKKVFSVFSLALLLGSPASASELITLSNGSQVCSFPCPNPDDPVIVLDDGRQVCPLQRPMFVEADVFVIKLNEDGIALLQSLRPSDSDTEQFAVDMEYQVTSEYVSSYGDIVGNFHLSATASSDSWRTVGNTNLSPAKTVSITAMSDESIGPKWEYDLRDGVVGNITKIGCDGGSRVESNVLVSHIEGFAPIDGDSGTFLMPIVRVFATGQSRSAEIGEGIIFGGIKNIVGSDPTEEFAVFVNVSENKMFAP